MKSELFTPLFGDYVPRNIYAMYGLPTAGKTLLAMTEVAGLVAQGARVLWIDTEGGLNFEEGVGVWNAWKPKLEARFGIKDLNENVEYHRFVDYEELMEWLNHPVKVEYEEKKISVRPQASNKRVDGTVYETFGRKQDNCFIVLDSLTSVFRLQFGSGIQNFPARGDAQGFLVHSLERLMKKTNAPLLITNHASVNPSMPFIPANMQGGSTVAYYSKGVLYLEMPKKKVLDVYRKCWAVRSPLYKKLGHYEWMRIDNDKAFIPCTEAEVQAIIGSTKKVEDEE